MSNCTFSLRCDLVYTANEGRERSLGFLSFHKSSILALKLDALFCPGHVFVLESVKYSLLDYNEPFAFYMNDFIEALCLHIIHETYFETTNNYALDVEVII